jgi:serine/threonine protein kinase
MDQESAEYTKSADMWSIGCILFELATAKRRVPFPLGDLSVKDLADGLISTPQLTVQDNSLLQEETLCPAASRNLTVLEQLNSILQLCLAVEPEKRVTAAGLKRRFEEMKLKMESKQ